MKRFIKAMTVIVALLLICTLLGPYLVLAIAKQPAAEDEIYNRKFATSYEEVRDNLDELVGYLRKNGVEVVTSEYAVNEAENLYIDNIYLPSTGENTNLIVLTTGVHGIEGYIGATMIEVFIMDILPQINRENTGVLIVANVNPYGMKYYRRYNENNVDLNRNFILDWDTFDRASNQEYPKVDTFLGPTGKIGNALWHEAGFYLSLAKTAVTEGADTISDALLTGQYEYPQGVYYGGDGDESSTVYLKDVFARCLESRYENIVHIDIHSGYGPRYNMVIFNSVYETMNEAESCEAFGYDYVIAYDSESFYATTGDTTDFFYRLAQQKQAGKQRHSLREQIFASGMLGKLGQHQRACAAADKSGAECPDLLGKHGQ